MGNVARTTAWAIGISINNTSTLSMDHVYVNMPNADGTFGTSIGVALAGLSASSYLVEVALNDVSTLGGSIGLELGDWIQGVYVDNSRFIGNDFGIRWAGVAGQADLFVAVANSHVNSGSRGIQSIVASALQIINTYVLHFPIASTSADWAGFEFQTMDSGLVSNNNIYGNGTSSAVPEYGVRLIGSNTSTIIGNHINNPKTAGIYLGSGTNATVAANNLGSAFAAGVPLVQDVTGNTSNLQMGNQRDGVADFNVNGPRIAGWGTSTGGVRGAVTGASTLPQVAAALAQLLTDLTTHGMIGV
jgi:parallel beta-helix repeat protein